MAIANWTELLSLVSDRLSIPDLLRLEAVCRPWRSFISDLRRHRQPPPPAQSPWLMFSGDEQSGGAPTSVTFYSVSAEKLYQIDLPAPSIRRAMWIGSAHGWLIAADEQSDLSLLNPITRRRIRLPPVSAFDHIDPILDSRGRIKEYCVDPAPKFLETRSSKRMHPYRIIPGELRFGLYRKAILSSSPSGGKDYTVVVILNQPCRCLAFAEKGGKKWTLISRTSGYQDMVYYKQQLYTVSSTGAVEVWDFSGNSPKPTVVVAGSVHGNGMMQFFMYLVPTPWGELLQVWRERTKDTGEFVTKQIRVHRVDFDNKKLIQVESLGDYALFLGCNLSMCVSALDVPGLEGNSAYVADDHWELSCLSKYLERDICIYNLKDGRLQRIVLPNPRLNWPPPIWFMPYLF